MVRTTAFSSSRFAVRVSVVPNIFTIYPQHFLMPEISETLKGSFTKLFGTVRQKIFDGKTWYPLVSIKFFDTPNFLRHWRDAHEIFRHCETQNFRRKNVICPLLSIIFFRYQKISGKQKSSFTKLFVLVLWDKKFRQNRDDPLLCMKIFDKRIFLKHQSVLQRNISALWDKKFLTENRDMPPLIHNFFSIPENFRKTEKFSYKAFRFGLVRQKVPKKPWCPPSYAWKFSIKEFFWNTKVFSNEIFRYSETKTSTKNRDTLPHLLSKLFRYSKLMKH